MRFQNISNFKYWPQIAVLILLLAGYAAYRYFAFYDTRSSDAYISAHVINMSSLVSGSVTHIYIHENQKVKKGDKLLDINPLPYTYAVQLAKAKLEMAQLNYQNEKQDIAKAQIIKAKSELDEANYYLNHTTLVAPEDGYISNFNLRIGQYIKAEEGLFALIETGKWWVVTRYRETAIRLIQAGDKAKIMIDMYPGKVFHGHVESIGWGINREQRGDAAPSPLVYLQATEDWIRIAQRFPVRISIDEISEEYPLRIGASATTITYR